MSAITLHLMLDALWRGRMAWLLVGAGLLLAWALVAVGSVSATAGVVASMIAVCVVGPMTSLPALMVRETRFFPLTSRDVWVAAWLLSTIVPVVLVAALHLAGVSIGLALGYPQPHAAQSLGFVAVCVFAYGGVMLPVGPLVGYTSHAASERRPTWFWASLATLMLFAYFGGLIAPWAAWSVLPTTFAEVGWRSAVVLAAGVVGALGALAWTPQRFGGIGRPVAPTNRAPLSAAHRAHTFTRTIPRGADRLTGLNRLLLPTLVWALGLALAGAVGMAWYFNNFEPSRSLYESFAASGLLPFGAAGLRPKGILGTALFFPFFAIGSNLAWGGHIRHLRVLPLSAAETTRLHLMTTMLLWAVVWTVILGIHLVVLGVRPATLRPELFIYLTGLSALVEAASRHGNKPGSLAALPALFLAVFVDECFWRLGLTHMPWTYVAAGSTALLTATLLTYRSLTRSTSSAGLYQPRLPSFNA